MCWIGDNIKKIAEEDIKCKKIIDHHIPSDTYYAFYHEFFEYELGKVYEQKVTPQVLEDYGDDDEFARINEGFHCYSMDIKMTRTLGGSITVENTKYNTHTMFPFHINNNFRTVVVQCTIPKGTEYYENNFGEIVTSKLIVEEEIQIKDELYDMTC